MNERILVVEDEPTISTGLRDDLEIEGFTVEVTEDGNAALSRILEGKFDLILLDLMLPGMDGFTVCREARLKGDHTPIIMLTAKGQEVDKIVGLELGADDYVTKPFSRRELLARIKAVMRRSQNGSEPGPVYRFGFHRALPPDVPVLQSSRWALMFPVQVSQGPPPGGRPNRRPLSLCRFTAR